MMTLELGLMSTCLFPRFSALYMFFSASFNTLIRTMAADCSAAGASQAYSCSDLGNLQATDLQGQDAKGSAH